LLGALGVGGLGALAGGGAGALSSMPDDVPPPPAANKPETDKPISGGNPRLSNMNGEAWNNLIWQEPDLFNVMKGKRGPTNAFREAGDPMLHGVYESLGQEYKPWQY